MDPEEDSWMINEARDSRNLRGTGTTNKSWNKKEVAKRSQIAQRRRLQAEGQPPKEEQVKIQRPVREKKYVNGKPKRESREESPVPIEQQPRQLKPNKKMQKNMRKQ